MNLNLVHFFFANPEVVVGSSNYMYIYWFTWWSEPTGKFACEVIFISQIKLSPDNRFEDNNNVPILWPDLVSDFIILRTTFFFIRSLDGVCCEM